MVQGLAYIAEGRRAHVVVADAGLDGERQAAQIGELCAAGIDALLVYPTAPPALLSAALDRAVAGGIPLFSHDSVDHPAVITEFVTPGGAMAELAAGLMDELLGGAGE